MNKSKCIGCEDNFYNGNNNLGVKECWSFSTAKLEMRKIVHINQTPPWKQAPVLLPSCYHMKQYVIVGPDRIN